MLRKFFADPYTLAMIAGAIFGILTAVVTVSPTPPTPLHTRIMARFLA